MQPDKTLKFYSMLISNPSTPDKKLPQVVTCSEYDKIISDDMQPDSSLKFLFDTATIPKPNKMFYRTATGSKPDKIISVELETDIFQQEPKMPQPEQ